MYAMMGKKIAWVPLEVDGVITLYQGEKLIHSSIFFSQMILLHTDEYYPIGAGRKSQPTVHNYYHDHDTPLNQPLLTLHISVKCKQTTRMALKAINLKRH